MRASTIIAFAGLVAASKAAILPGIDAVIDLPATEAVARVLVGDETCPVTTGGLVNANVFAAVTLRERATITVTEALGVPPLFLNQDLQTQATVNLDVAVCLCLDANVATNAIDIPASVYAQAEADIQAYLKTKATTSLAANVLGLVQANGDINADVSLAVAGRTNCECGTTSIPSCRNGQCVCIPCPTGQVYNPNTGTCNLTPSTRSRSKERRAALARSVANHPVVKRQATRADIERRSKLDAAALEA